MNYRYDLLTERGCAVSPSQGYPRDGRSKETAIRFLLPMWDTIASQGGKHQGTKWASRCFPDFHATSLSVL